ncbi:hypothetical protein BDW02DRAFT_92188 [Decorospora gaudefroyi]|uniref:Uncharacterized protein n=1 Tax=Decorospora gaudefroyi TaxID=184978 RepID=A0A6A5K2S0_9PLEO|nr:hypothetical protein BDW02DRAFT_92188 [Decorospora gaudefroyi]
MASSGEKNRPRKPSTSPSHSSYLMSSTGDSERPPLSPADCRTLEKILHDVRGSSPISSTPYFSHVAPGSPGIAATASSSVYSGDEDDDGREFVDGDERDTGYEDEDDSMELSDSEQTSAEAEDGDTIEDIMNLPGKTAPPAPIQDFSSLYAHDQPTPDEAMQMRLHRAVIERELGEPKVDGTTLEEGATPIFQVLQERIGMHHMEDGEATSFQDYSTGPSRSIPTRRRASEDPPPPPSTPFTPNDITQETPFAKTLTYFKQYKGKENSPCKRRRNACAPAEIAELAREAAVEEEEAKEDAELENLEQYRDMDLAPMEPVMESVSAGDLITCGTPAKANDKSLLGRTWSASDLVSHSPLGYAAEPTSPLHRNADMGNAVAMTPSPRRHTLPIEQDEDQDADREDSEPESLEQRQIIVYAQHPTFVTVVGLLPAAMFWATAAPVVKYAHGAFDALVEKVKSLKV